MKTIRKILHLVFEKYGMIKMAASAILALLFFWLFDKTGQDLYKVLSIIPGVYFGILAIILFSYAWIINPIKAAKEKADSCCG